MGAGIFALRSRNSGLAAIELVLILMDNALDIDFLGLHEVLKNDFVAFAVMV